MKEATRERLIELSAAFYVANAAAFGRSRQNAWDSWRQLMGIAQQATDIRTVLDLGCGNGRLAKFLSEQQIECEYLGVDSSPALIEAARIDQPQRQFRLESIDGFMRTEGSFDAIAAFGLFHHLPGRAYREDLIGRLANRLESGGVLLMSLWQPMNLPNFDSKVLAQPDFDDLEPNDYLLGWNAGFEHLRYCHHFDDDEIQALAATPGLRQVAALQGSGNDVTNHYLVLQKSD